jgi:hypothetical protein
MFLLLFQVVSSVGTSNVPESPGVFVKQGNASWVKAQPAKALEGKTKGLDAYVMTDGYTNLNMRVAYQGAKALLRIKDAKPVFFVREIGSARNYSIIRLDSKKDRRTFRSVPSEATVDNKLGFRKSDIVKMAVIENSDGSFSTAPVEALKPGEYLILFDTITSAYDFGVD